MHDEPKSAKLLIFVQWPKKIVPYIQHGTEHLTGQTIWIFQMCLHIVQMGQCEWALRITGPNQKDTVEHLLLHSAATSTSPVLFIPVPQANKYKWRLECRLTGKSKALLSYLDSVWE